ncbi:hypothetical protein GWI33_007498 [Rhynchophorus ferrugineus]|uniref:Uncharacterized protein n=1 Tax=Rhynchophorus ferrugineus TaxID=354439 RepID=A0A834IHJ4_RHYFE|nr:hypothetical protein GWI33_007498 [Rhynchophorus ferrugineus]
MAGDRSAERFLIKLFLNWISFNRSSGVSLFGSGWTTMEPASSHRNGFGDIVATAGRECRCDRLHKGGFLGRLKAPLELME